MQAKQTRNFVFVGERDLVGQVITSFAEQLGVNEQENLNKQKDESFKKHIFKKGEKENEKRISITECYEGSDRPTSADTRAEIFQTNPKAVFFILKTPPPFERLDVKQIKSNVEFSLRQAYDDELARDTPVFLIFTDASADAQNKQKPILFQSTKAASPSRPNNVKSFYFFKAQGSVPSAFFRDVFYCPVENGKLFDLIWEGKDENELERVAVSCEVTQTAVTASSSSKNNSPNISSSTHNAESKKTTRIVSVQNDTEAHVYRIEFLVEDLSPDNNKNEQEGKNAGGFGRQKRKRDENKTDGIDRSASAKEKGTGLGVETGSDSVKSAPSFTSNPIRHALKRGAVVGLMVLLVTAIAAVITEAAFQGLLFTSAPGGILFDFIVPTFFSALGPIGAFTLAMGMSMALIVAAVALYDYYQHTHSSHLEIAGKVGLAVFVLGALFFVIANANGAVEDILYNLLANTVFATTPPAWFLAFLVVSVLFIASAVGAAIAGTVSVVIENKQHEGSKVEDTALPMTTASPLFNPKNTTTLVSPNVLTSAPYAKKGSVGGDEAEENKFLSKGLQ